MIIQDIISHVRLWIWENSANSVYTDAEILNVLNLENQTLGTWVRNTFDTYWTKTITYVKNSTGIYALPNDYVDIQAVKLTRTDQEFDYSLKQIKPMTDQRDGFYIENSNLVVNLLTFAGQPDVDYQNVVVKYTPRMCYLTYGTPTSPGAGQIVLTADSEYFDDAYNGYEVIVYNPGTTTVNRYTITDYTGSTRTATLSGNPTVTAATRYSLLSPIPESHHELLVLGTALRLYQFDSDKPSGDIAFQYQTKLELFKNDIESRVENFNKQTYLSNPMDYDYGGGVYGKP